MFRPNPAIISFSSERVSVFIKSMRFCNDGEIDFINTDNLSDENLMMAGLGRNIWFYIHPPINIVRNTCCVIDITPLPIIYTHNGMAHFRRVVNMCKGKLSLYTSRR